MKEKYVLAWSPTKYISPSEWAEGSLWLYVSFNPNSAYRTPYVYVGASIPLFPHLVSFDELYSEAEEVIFPNYLEEFEGSWGKFKVSKESFPRIVRTWDAHEGIVAFRFDSLTVFEGIPIEAEEASEALSWSPLKEALMEIDEVYLEALSEGENIVDEIAKYEISGIYRSERPLDYLNKVRRYMERVKEFVKGYRGRELKKYVPEPEMDIGLKRYLKEMLSDIYGIEGEEAWKEYMNYVIPNRTREHYSGRLEYFLGSIYAHYCGMKEKIRQISRKYEIYDYRGVFLNIRREIKENPFPGIEKEIPHGPFRIEAALLGRIFPVVLRDYLMKDHREAIYWAKQILSALAIRRCKEAYLESYDKFKEVYFECLDVLSSL